MICQKLPHCLTGVMLVIILIGCTAPTEAPIAVATFSQPSVPTQAPTVTPNPKPTSVKISSFEECFVGGWIQNTYPRQCITNSGEIFTELLGEEVIYSTTYSSTTSHETGRFITSTRDGGYFITGDANHGCWVLKLSTSRKKDWRSSFEQELRQEFQHYSAGFSCLFARQTPGNGYVIMGQEYDLYSGLFKRSFFMMTLDQEGNWVSGQVIAEKAGKIPYLDHDGNLIRLTSMGTSGRVTETMDGGYIIVSQHPDRSPDSRTHMTKTDKNGNYVWDRNLCLDKNIQQAEEKKIVCSHNSYNYVRDVIQLQDGGFVITGIESGAWSLKTDINGNIEWIQPSPLEFGGSKYGSVLRPLPDGGYLMAGNHDGGTLIKMDSTGNMQWSRTYRGGAFTAMAQKPNGEITIMGSTSSPGPVDLWLLGINSTILK